MDLRNRSRPFSYLFSTPPIVKSPSKKKPKKDTHLLKNVSVLSGVHSNDSSSTDIEVDENIDNGDYDMELQNLPAMDQQEHEVSRFRFHNYIVCADIIFHTSHDTVDDQGVHYLTRGESLSGEVNLSVILNPTFQEGAAEEGGIDIQQIYLDLEGIEFIEMLNTDTNEFELLERKSIFDTITIPIASNGYFQQNINYSYSFEYDMDILFKSSSKGIPGSFYLMETPHDHRIIRGGVQYLCTCHIELTPLSSLPHSVDQLQSQHSQHSQQQQYIPFVQNNLITVAREFFLAQELNQTAVKSITLSKLFRDAEFDAEHHKGLITCKLDVDRDICFLNHFAMIHSDISNDTPLSIESVSIVLVRIVTIQSNHIVCEMAHDLVHKTVEGIPAFHHDVRNTKLEIPDQWSDLFAQQECNGQMFKVRYQLQFKCNLIGIRNIWLQTPVHVIPKQTILLQKHFLQEDGNRKKLFGNEALHKVVEIRKGKTKCCCIV